MSLTRKLAALLLTASLSVTGSGPVLAQSSQNLMLPDYTTCDGIRDRFERRRCYDNARPRPHGNHGRKSNDDDIGAAIGLGIVGLAIGAIVAGAAAEDQKKQDRQHERWLAYCSQKYRSFDPYTGTYIDRYGRERRCR